MGHHDTASASNYTSSSSQLPLLISSTNYTSASLNFKPRMDGADAQQLGRNSSDLKLSYVEQRHRRLIRHCSSKQQQVAFSQLKAAVLAFKWKLALFLGIFGDYDRRRRKRRVARIAKAMASALIFAAIGVGVPVLNGMTVKCSDCDSSKQMPFQKLLDVSECTLCAISVLCLIYLLRKYGLRHLFLVDDVCIESRKVQEGYLAELKSIFLVLPKILLPFFIVELVHSILWFRDATVSSLPLLANQTHRKVIMCILSMVSWTYNNAMFILMVLLFKLMCSLQLLRLHDYYRLLQRQQIEERSATDAGGDEEEGGARPLTSVLLILQEHIRLREQLLLISHRFRVFVVMTLFAVTLSQFAILFQVTASGGKMNFRRTGDLVVCCSLQLVGMVLCLRGAAKITHMAQRIVAVVSQWHAVASCASDQDIAVQRQLLPQIKPDPDLTINTPTHDDEESGDESAVKPSDEKPTFSFSNLNKSQPAEAGDGDQYVLLEPSGQKPAGRFRRAVWPFLFINRLVSNGGSALSGVESPVSVQDFGSTDEDGDSIYGDSEDQSIEEESDLRAALQLFRSTKDSLAGADSFHKRHALVTYLQNCSTGISLYGFVLDRGCLYTIFALELSIVLWTLGKTLILSSS